MAPDNRQLAVGANIAARLLEYAISVVRIGKDMTDDFANVHVAKQMIRCATSAGANYEEGRAAQSRADFIHKLSIATKELRESIYWLRIASAFVDREIMTLVHEAESLAAILGRSIATARRNATD